jgi:hypothetical protein
LPDGNVAFSGRIDDQVKIRGFRVEPAEVSSTMERMDGISRALVLARDRASNKVLVAYYTCSDGQSVARHDLHEFLQDSLPAYMVPTFFVPMERFPLLPNGKIDRKSLPAPTQDDAPASSDYSAPSNEMEAELVKIWQDILGIDKIGVNESFQSLGGDSLSSLRALARMSKLNIPAHVARGITQGKTIREIVGEEGLERVGGEDLTAEMRTILSINILRGIMLVLVIAGHWVEGFLNLLLGKGNGAAWVHELTPLTNLSTPGFDYVFGIGLGFFFYTKYRRNPALTRKTLLFSTSILFAGIFADAAMSLATMRWAEIDSAVFFNHFFSALLYYAVALATATLWFWLIAKSRREYLACVGFMFISYLIYHACLRLFLTHEQTGFLQLIRLMLVARFSYFNMAIGSFGGILAGIYLKKHYTENLSGRYCAMGAACVALGFALLFSGGKTLAWFYSLGDLTLWQWAFYAGVVLLLAGSIDSILKHFNALPEIARTALQLISAIGQLTFPLFVLSELVINGERVLELAHLPRLVSLGTPVGLFCVISGGLIFKVYRPYFGGGVPLQVE